MQTAELEARLRRAIRRWKAGRDPHDTNVLLAELKVELCDLIDGPGRMPPGRPAPQAPRWPTRLS